VRAALVVLVVGGRRRFAGLKLTLLSFVSDTTPYRNPLRSSTS